MDNKLKIDTIGESSKEQYCYNYDEQETNNTCTMNITNLPIEIFHKVLGYCSFGYISKIRKVSKGFNQACSYLLNAEFERLKAVVLERYNYLKSQMPRRESSRRKHPLARENDIIGTVHMRLALLNLTLGKHVDKNHGCFFAGEVLDEVNKLLDDLKKNDPTPYKITDELFDLSTMAVEYFKDNFEPVLPQVLCISEFLEKSMHSTEKINSGALKETARNDQDRSQGCSNSAMDDFKKSLRMKTRLVFKNRREINSTNLQLKSINLEISNLENMIYQIKQRQKECKEIAIPKEDMNELLIKIINCNKRIDSCESNFEHPKSEQETAISDTMVDGKMCKDISTTVNSIKIAQHPDERNMPSSSHSAPLSQAEKNEGTIEHPNTSARCVLKRKCEVISENDSSKKKRHT